MYVYAIYNRNVDKLYIGETDNLENRIQQHNNKYFPKSYTARYCGQWILIYFEEVPNRRTARKREKQLKSYQGREFLKKYIPE